MQKLRRLWYICVVLLTIAFVGYRVMDRMKADSSGPVFSCEKDTIKVSIEDGEDALLKGITAEDKKDGDVTGSILLEKLSAMYDGNKRTATYAAFDSDGHISKMEREIIYTDYVSPRFELTGSLRFRTGESLNIDKIIKAEDCIDGDISNKVKLVMDTTINNRVPGVYQVEYEVSNSAGDLEKLPVEVKIYDTLRNEIQLNLKEYLVYYEGEDINYKDYLKSIISNNTEYFFEGVEPEANENAAVGESSIPKNRVTVEENVNTKKAGVYPVYFYYEHYGQVFTQGVEVLYVVVK